MSMRIINPRRMRRRVTVVIVCVCVSVCLLSQNQLPTSFLRRKQFYRVLYGVFNVFTVWLSLKRFVQELWRHLPVTAAFLAPWRTFDLEAFRARRTLTSFGILRVALWSSKSHRNLQNSV